MNKAKIMLSVICVVAAVGGALASKSASNAIFTYYYSISGVYHPVEVDFGCPGTGVECTTTTALGDPAVTLYTITGTNLYKTVRKI